jgi:tRNA uridine 5-carboxymethylaminomethyl modification enzyme
VGAFELLRRPEVGYAALLELTGAAAATDSATDTALDDRLPPQVERAIEVRAAYAGYIERAQEEIERARAHEDAVLPAGLDYAGLAGLSTEVRQALTDGRPRTIGQAARIPGVTPAAVSILLVYLRRYSTRVA